MNVRTAWSSLALLVAFTVSLALPLDAQAQGLPSLVTTPRGTNNQAIAADVAKAGGTTVVIRTRSVRPDANVIAAALDAMQSKPGTKVQLNIGFFADVTLTVTLDRFDRPGRGVTSFHGTAAGDPLSDVVIVWSASGAISTNALYLDKAYQILSRGDGQYQAREIDRRSLQEGDDIVIPPASKQVSADVSPGVLATATDTVDVMVVYSDVTRAAAGGTAAIESEIDLGIAVANSAYANSGVTQRVRLVHTEEIAYALDTPALLIQNALNDVTNGTNGLGTVAGLRNVYGADLVSFWVEGAGINSSTCGIAWLMSTVSASFAPNGYSVLIRPNCAVANQSFPHEMGHNMGLRHDVFVDPGTTPYAYAHGYVDPQHRFRDIMSYSNACFASAPAQDCPRVNEFSSPLKTFQGAVTGTAAGADNAHALNNTLPTVAGFRSAVADAGTLEVRMNGVTVSEGAGTVQVPIARLGAASGAVSVHYATADNTAFAGTDYTSTTGTLNWADGDSADKFIAVPVTQNATPDGTRTFTVTIDTPTGGAALSARTTTTVSVTDDEPNAWPLGCTMPAGFTTTAGATTGWAVSSDQAAEGSCSLKSNLMITPDANTCSSINKAQTQFTATFLAGTVDFKARVSSEGSFDCLRFSIDGSDQNIGSCSGTGGLGLTAPINQTETNWQSFSIPIGSGTHTLRWSYEADCFSAGDNASWIDALAMPIDPASLSTFAFAQPSLFAIEGAAANVNVVVNRTGNTAGAASVSWTTANGVATAAGTDFGTLGSTAQKTGTLSWAAGDATPKNITVGLSTANVPIINNTTFDPIRNFTVQLTSTTGGALIGAQNTTQINLLDTESTVGFTATTANVSEAGPNVLLTVTRTPSTSVLLSQTVTYTTAAGTATATTDYTTTTGTITFAVGEDTKTIAVGPVTAPAPWIKVVNDTTIESPETFTVTLSAPTNGMVLGANKVATVTITSDDSGIVMAAPTRNVGEGDGTMQVVVNRVGPAVGAVGVTYTINNGTAIRGTNFNSAAASGTLNWADGDGTSRTIDITLVNDAIVNTARTFVITLSAPTGGALLASPSSTTVTIADDDNAVQFTAATMAVMENVTGGNVTLTVARTGVLTQPASVTYTTADGTGHAGSDYTFSTGTVSWAAGVGGNKTFTVPIINNSLVQASRNFTVGLSSPTGTGTALGTNATITVTINDDDKGIQFAQAGYTVMERINPNVVLSVARIGPTSAAASATWATVNGNAISGTDFGVTGSAAPRTGTLSWAANDAANKTITIPIINNSIGGQPDRLFQVTLTPGAGLILGTPAIATVTIQDDDIPPQTTVQFAQPKFIVLENVGNAVLAVTRTDLGPGCGLGATVSFATTAGTALATSDFTAKTGTVVWPGGDCSAKQITIAIVNNTVAEPPESFKVTLSNPTPGTNLGVPQEATVTILDDDEKFPPMGAMPPGFSTPVAATAGWHVTAEPGAYEGAYSLRSDQIGDGETAELEMTGTFAAGSLNFRVKISSEPDFDLLSFFIDGVQQPTTWSGTAIAGWQASPAYTLSAGVHTLRWVYAKDGSASVGMDAAFLDGLVTPTFTP
jgi:hypothetical protein